MNGTRVHHEIRSGTLCGIGNIFSKKLSMKVLVCYVCVVTRAKNYSRVKGTWKGIWRWHWRIFLLKTCGFSSKIFFTENNPAVTKTKNKVVVADCVKALYSWSECSWFKPQSVVSLTLVTLVESIVSVTLVINVCLVRIFSPKLLKGGLSANKWLIRTNQETAIYIFIIILFIRFHVFIIQFLPRKCDFIG